MPEPILVVDFGTFHTSAALVVGEHWRLIPEPDTNASSWPSAVCVEDGQLLVGAAAEQRKRAAPRRYLDGARRAVDAGASMWLGDREILGAEVVAAFLDAIRGEAVRRHGQPITRLTLAVPPDYTDTDARRTLLIAAGQVAGFPDVELLPDSVAAVLDPASGPDYPDGSLVVVCDLGATWNATLVRVAGDRTAQLAHVTSSGGREIDAQLLAGLRSQAWQWLEPMLSAPGDAGARAHHEMADFVRRLNHQLTDATEVVDHLTPLAPPSRLTRDWVAAVAEPVLHWLASSGEQLAAAAGSPDPPVAGTVLTGGWTRQPAVADYLHRALAGPVRQAVDPQLAVLRGSVRWAAGAGRRRVLAEAPPWRAEPLSWRIPGAGGELASWLVAEGGQYQADAVLARVRRGPDHVFDLTAANGGRLLSHQVAAGAPTGPVLLTAAARSATALAAQPPPHRHRWWTTGGWLLTTQLLVEYDRAGSYVRTRDLRSGLVTGTFRPDTGGHRPHRARVFADPDGVLCLFTWDDQGRFTIWDVTTGGIRTRFSGPPDASCILVDEAHWKMAAESGDNVSVGRYRRTVVTFWELGRGQRTGKVIDDEWRRRHPAYTERSRLDRFADSATSPDGQLRAEAAAAVVTLSDVTTGQQVFRVEPDPGSAGATPVSTSSPTRAHTAFSADGRFLLVSCAWDGSHQADDRSLLDVWQI